MDLILKIETALKRACQPQEAEITLSTDPGARVSGIVLCRRFEGLSPVERQDLIWKHLDAALNPSERTRISFIVADTPDEYAAIQEDGPAA